ncbi:DUF2524 family protein [Halalkalibacter okhensis]|uniref:DUF2524 domain-containing protein n=1 Tax=Halalkalibacter okhensis TaxID=333138 RepID=A0A0B0IG69_9BACI|nr:DUF2524 family protein [Halalkalibacter okhensis]KHF40285.1 hypothetical protein LQ50_09795 [Halalkalibacter okhensis]
MAERTHLEHFLEKAETTLEEAQKTFDDSQRVQEGDYGEYIQAQRNLQELNDELGTLMHAATPEQRDQLYRTQIQVNQLQNHFILKR